MINYPRLLKELQGNLKDPKGISYDTEQETLMDFKSEPGAEIGMNPEEEFGIYMAFVTNGKTEKERKKDLSGFIINSTNFISPLINYLSLLFSENTNSDACSFKIEIDTDHINDSQDATWEIRVSVSDYLS